jgi:hypothetical protein
MQSLQVLVQLPDLRAQGSVDQHVDLSTLRYFSALKRARRGKIKTAA